MTDPEGRVGRGRDERGVASLLAVVLAMAMLTAVGITYDGGRVLAAKVEALNEASEAARAGAQSVSINSRGGSSVDLGPGAVAAAEQYLAQTGHQGRVSVNGDQITVTVTFVESLTVLSLAGYNRVPISETSTATATSGG